MQMIEDRFSDAINAHFSANVLQPVQDGLIVKSRNILTLSDKGKLFADKIASDLFMV